MYAIKAEIQDVNAKLFEFKNQKTMYGGKKIAAGDTIYLFASENEGDSGLIAMGVILKARSTPRKLDVERQTPRTSIKVKRTGSAKRSLGRNELKGHDNWNDGKSATELNFKFYRQATNKIFGLSEQTAAFLRSYF